MHERVHSLLKTQQQQEPSESRSSSSFLSCLQFQYFCCQKLWAVYAATIISSSMKQLFQRNNKEGGVSSGSYLPTGSSGTPFVANRCLDLVWWNPVVFLLPCHYPHFSNDLEQSKASERSSQRAIWISVLTKFLAIYVTGVTRTYWSTTITTVAS